MYFHKDVYPSNIMGGKGKKANLRKDCKTFSIIHGQLIYNNTMLFISSIEQQYIMISHVHKGLGHDPKAKAMASHCGRDSAIQEISNKFFWQNTKGNFKEFIKKCGKCQKQGRLKKV